MNCEVPAFHSMAGKECTSLVLRRFNARYAENDIWKLALDIDQLREKILNLFKLSPDADITLTYIDEDGEEVTLEDNEDLKDVVEQQLDPLRITVELNSAGSDLTLGKLAVPTLENFPTLVLILGPTLVLILSGEFSDSSSDSG
nr:protein NBR1 homolog isoform X2 [Ipomoea batatas]GMD86419.1 protein NBR1 homolog isoform X2 [Ipomoea batatas]